MSIHKRIRKDGSYVWECRINRRDRVTNKRRPINVGSFSTKREAEAAEAKARVELGQGTLLEPDRTTLGALFDAWLPVAAQSLRPNTATDYRTTIRVHIIPALGHVPVRSLTAAAVQQQFNAWAAAGVSPWVLSKVHQHLRQALDFGVRMRLVGQNVARDVKAPRIQRTEIAYWSIEESRAFLTAARDNELWPVWPLLLAEGLRRGEALGVRWEDVDLERGILSVRQSVICDKANRGAVKIAVPKTRASIRTIRLAPLTVAALKAHKPVWAARALAAEVWADYDLIICTDQGEPVHPSCVRRQLNRICQVAGIRTIRVHDVRHSSASMLLAGGVSIKVIADKLGHRTITTTADTYLHTSPGMLDEAAATMDRLLG